MKKSNRKGFTIVELVIVIAVIAILAAVLIPTFTNLIKKANESSDVQAVRQMNTILAAENAFVGGITINDAVAALKEAGFNGDKYVPLVSGHYFFYDQDAKQIVYTEYKDGKYNVLFPKDATIEGHALFSLSGDVAKKDYAAPTPDADGNLVFSIGSAEEYAQLAADFKDVIAGKTPAKLEGFAPETIADTGIACVTGKNIVITLTDNIDMKGASFNLNFSSGSFTLNGNGKTISGIVNNSGFAVSSSNTDKTTSAYGGAFLGYVCDANITFNNITFKNCHFGNENVKASAVFVGQMNGTSTLTLNTTAVVDCTVAGEKGVAVYVGHACQNTKETNVYTGSHAVTFTGTNTVSGCELTATKEPIAAIIGRCSAATASVNGTKPTMSITMTVAGATVDATGRDIATTKDGNAVEYTGSWTK